MSRQRPGRIITTRFERREGEADLDELRSRVKAQRLENR